MELVPFSVINEYLKKNYHNNLLLDLWFWRDAEGHEVDLIWQNSELLNLVEIKASETIMPEMFKGLSYFEKLKSELMKSASPVKRSSKKQLEEFLQVIEDRLAKGCDPVFTISKDFEVGL